MSTNVSLEELIILNDEIVKLKIKFPEASLGIIELIKKRRNSGYRNFCRLFTGEWIPESLKIKGLQENEED